PKGKRPNPKIYEIMGEENIFKMLEDFYKELEKTEIRPLFPKNMVASSKKSALFFIFILGGPPLYQQKFGPPRMRARHLPFPINEKARQIWLQAFYKILDHPEKYSFPREYLAEFKEFLDTFSAWMVNKE
ncbi:MAG: hypothetical protein D6767_04695, partial [Candidatus Hydrogenedentota bacterium]